MRFQNKTTTQNISLHSIVFSNTRVSYFSGCRELRTFSFTRFNQTRQIHLVYFEQESTPLPASSRLVVSSLPQLSTSSSLSQTMNEASFGNGQAQDHFRYLNALPTCQPQTLQTPHNLPLAHAVTLPIFTLAIPLSHHPEPRAGRKKKRSRMSNNNIRPAAPREILQ